MTPSALIALIQDAANSAAQTPAAGAAPSTGTAPITDPPAAGGGWTQSLMSFLPMIAIFEMRMLLPGSHAHPEALKAAGAGDDMEPGESGLPTLADEA